VNTGRDRAKPKTAAEAFGENVLPVAADVADVRQIEQLFGAVSANTVNPWWIETPIFGSGPHVARSRCPVNPTRKGRSDRSCLMVLSLS
jgi:hypothetical protein